jgi:hypothetical protein
MKTRFSIGDNVFWMDYNRIHSGKVDTITIKSDGVIYSVGGFRTYEQFIFGSLNDIFDMLQEKIVYETNEQGTERN